ncbi:hypothetical protein GJ496_009294 [Pomphorhynchus laevis]|nr:hypothetical protein GJ496_009294 [Pomphorhynchus laevis]
MLIRNMDSFTHRNGGVTAESRIKNADILCKIKYTNNLPDIPFDAKFIKYTFDNSRFINYKPTSLEKSHKWDIQNDIDLEVSVDLINRQLYKIGPEPAVLHPDDEKLLEDEPVNRANAHRAELNARIVPWLRKTEYIGSTNQMNISRDSNLDSSRSTKIKKRVEESINFPSREQQIETIEKSFDDAQKLIENHYSKPHVHKIAEWYIFPDEEIWPFPCSQVIFDDDPTPNGFEMDATKLTSEALIRAITDHNDEQFMGYFLPDHQSLEKLTNSDDSKLPENKEYFFRMNRDYNWNVKGSSTQQGEESYFVIFNDDKVTYAPFDTRYFANYLLTGCIN